MITKHRTIIENAQNMSSLNDNTIDLIVTSPPYPMIQMWDSVMYSFNPEIEKEMEKYNGVNAFNLMHIELDKVWSECHRVLKDGGFACINIGDATRTLNGNFALYSNHSRIIKSFLKLGFNNLPNILWRKQTNAPNKFMGSGMLPAGAYVTLEHEWILIFRKGDKRVFKSELEKLERRKSAYFWEERNVWFSDIWDFKGVKQRLENTNGRERSAAFPIELPYRLINMFSLRNDTILDPFVGTGTTTLASIISQRNSIGYEIDDNFNEIIKSNIENVSIKSLNNIVKERIQSHIEFIEDRKNSKKEIKHFNDNMNVPVITGQEKDMELTIIENIREIDSNLYEVKHTNDLNFKNENKQLNIF